MEKTFQNRFLSILILVAVLIAGSVYADRTKIFWADVDTTTTPTTLAGWGITDGASDTDLSNHETATGSHAATSQTFTNKTLTDPTNHISGTIIDSGTVDEARVDSDIARDSELPGNASFTFTGLSDTPANYTGASLQSVRVNAGETALEFYTPTTTSAVKTRQVVVLSAGASTTVTLGEALSTDDEKKLMLSGNGVTQAYTTYTIDSSTQITLGGELASGSTVDILEFN